MTTQIEALTEWVKSNPPEVVAARLKELDDALGQTLRRLTAEPCKACHGTGEWPPDGTCVSCSGTGEAA